jgi:hypothetical protein
LKARFASWNSELDYNTLHEIKHAKKNFFGSFWIHSAKVIRTKNFCSNKETTTVEKEFLPRTFLGPVVKDRKSKFLKLPLLTPVGKEANACASSEFTQRENQERDHISFCFILLASKEAR